MKKILALLLLLCAVSLLASAAWAARSTGLVVSTGTAESASTQLPASYPQTQEDACGPNSVFYTSYPARCMTKDGLKVVQEPFPRVVGIEPPPDRLAP